MTTEEALEFIESKKSASATVDQEPVNSTEDIASVSDVANENKDDTVKATGTSKAEEATNVQPKADDKVNNAKAPISEITPEQKRNYAFAKEKQKRRDQKARYESRIEELESELKKYKGLNLEDFKNDQDAYMEYKIDQRLKSEEVSRLKNDYNVVHEDDIEYENEMRIENSFDTPEEKEEYRTTVSKYGPILLNYLEQKGDEVANAFLSTLDNIDKFPKVMSKLLKDGNAVDYITAIPDPYVIKQRLYAAANKILNPPKPKAKMPIIGKQVSNQVISDQKKDWVSYLKNH